MPVRRFALAARKAHAGLFWFTLTMAATAAVLVLLVIVDRRTLLGQPVWFKPLKFALSFALYATSFAWMMSLLPAPGRWLRRAASVAVGAGVLEMVIIVGQAARGRRSHFNLDTPVDSALYGVMGAAVAVLWLATAVLAARVVRIRGIDPAATAAVRAGLVIGLAGAALGVTLVLHDGHGVGVPDGGPGLWLLGWSTTGGDLRIGHFIGMHALQLLPLLAVVLTVAGQRRLDDRRRLAVVHIAAATYAAVVVVVTWQAYRAQPLLSPDGLTLTAWAVIVVGAGTALAIALRRPTDARQPERPLADEVPAAPASS